jgi:hypothetical protein
MPALDARFWDLGKKEAATRPAKKLQIGNRKTRKLLIFLAGATGLGPSTFGVTGHQFCNDFNVTWNVF